MTEEEERRSIERRQAMMRLPDPALFNPREHCNHRSAEDLLPDEVIGSFLAFQLADNDLLKWREIEETMDELEITIGFAFKRATLYLSLGQQH